MIYQQACYHKNVGLVSSSLEKKKCVARSIVALCGGLSMYPHPTAAAKI
ncbi:hypothetical protein [Microcoleus sp. PH2017_01_SCD_O_A]|nr:hypothetical protein [Microcoleus sp. PH2017_01_SCD_O_A]